MNLTSLCTPAARTFFAPAKRLFRSDACCRPTRKRRGHYSGGCSGTRSRDRFRHSPLPVMTFQNISYFVAEVPLHFQKQTPISVLCRLHGRRESAPRTGTCNSSFCRYLLRRRWRCAVKRPALGIVSQCGVSEGPGLRLLWTSPTTTKSSSRFRGSDRVAISLHEFSCARLGRKHTGRTAGSKKRCRGREQEKV